MGREMKIKWKRIEIVSQGKEYLIYFLNYDSIVVFFSVFTIPPSKIHELIA